MTTEQNDVTYQSQRRWYDFVTGMFNDMQKTGNKFEELMHHFMFSLDKECIMVDA